MMIAAQFAINGCSGEDTSTASTDSSGRVLLLMHDKPVDDFKEVWLTVASVRMIGSGANDDSPTSGQIVLDQAARMDFLALDSMAQILAAANVEPGAYSKIRLEVSDPEFVRNDDSVFSGDDVKLVANGHVDINMQGDMLIIGNEVTIISLDLDLDNSLQINQTGNGRYILHPQIFIDNSIGGTEGIIIVGATVRALNLDTRILTISTAGTASDALLAVTTNSHTGFFALGGVPIELATFRAGDIIDIVGTIDIGTGLVTASEMRVNWYTGHNAKPSL
jgi:hypothetical protein